MARVFRSVDNALAVLESFSVERPELGVTELSHTLGLGKSTIRRLLTSLASRRHVRKNPETERFLRRHLRAYTPSTPTDPATLRKELDRIRAAGHALDNEEFAVGLTCVATPLFDHARRVVASLGIAGPAVRLADERLSRLAPLVREAAAGVSRALGAGASRPLGARTSRALGAHSTI